MGNCSKEDRSDINPNYNTFMKTSEKKDGLDIYKTKEYIHSEYQIRCPIIKDKLNEFEKGQMEIQINNSDKNIQNLFNKYNSIINDQYDINIFNKLESINSEIESAKKILEQNRYFLHACKKQKIYLDISMYDNDNDFNNLINDKRYIFDNWKNNLNTKNALLEERRINYEKRKKQDEIDRRERELQEKKWKEQEEIARKKRELKQKKENEVKKLKQKYKKEFEEYCIEKERGSLEMAKSNVDQKVMNLDLNNMDINEKRNQADLLYNNNILNIKFNINRSKLKNYIRELFGCEPNNLRIDSNDLIEENEFKFFISSREGISLDDIFGSNDYF